MSIFEIVFSPTGGTQKVSCAIASGFKKPTKFIDLMKFDCDYSEFCFSENDICLVSVPSYGGRIPAITEERLLKMSGGGALAVMMAVYGNRAYEDTLIELEAVLTRAGFRCIAAVSALAQHSIMNEFAATRPYKQDIEELETFSIKIVEKCEKGDYNGPVKVPGSVPYREYKGLAIKPKANNKCTRCGECALQCPVGAISREDPSITDKNKCITCMRCVKVCPKQARNLNSLLVGVAAKKMKKSCSDRKQNELFI